MKSAQKHPEVHYGLTLPPSSPGARGLRRGSGRFPGVSMVQATKARQCNQLCFGRLRLNGPSAGRILAQPIAIVSAVRVVQVSKTRPILGSVATSGMVHRENS